MRAKISNIFRSPPEFIRKASISFSMRFGGLFIQFGGSIIVARLLGAEALGAFVLASTWAVFIGILLPLGLGDLAIREIPKYLTKDKQSLVVGYLLTLCATILSTGAIAALVFAILERFQLLTLAPGWKLVALLAVVHGFVLSVSHTLNSYQRILTSQFLESIARQVIYLALIGAVLLLGHKLSPTLLFDITLVAAFAVLAVMLLVLNKVWRTQSQKLSRPEFRLSIWFAGALPLLMTTIANRLQLDLDVLMVGSLLGTYEVGIYRAAARAALLVTIANMVALQLVGPMLSRSIAINDRDSTQYYLKQSAIVSFVTGISICIIFGVWTRFYLGLFGPQFIEAKTAMRILLIGQATIALAGPDAILLIMLKRERLVMAVTTTGVAINFILNYALIGKFGIEGAAFASFVSMAFVRITLVTYVIRRTGYNTTISYFFTRRFRG
ncbi:MAG: oligosaccharide flippase family protein [Marinosulfonomonas sp.]